MDLRDLAVLVDRGLTIMLLMVTVGVVIFILRAFWIEFRNPRLPGKIRVFQVRIARSRQIRCADRAEA